MSPRLVAVLGVVLWAFLAGCKKGRDGGVDEDVLSSIKSAAVLLRSHVGTGSGFVVKHEDDSDFILTNAHVVEGAATLKVTYFSGTPKETSYEGTVIVRDEAHDLALLRLRNPAPQAAPLEGRLGVSETTPVVVVGFPFGEALALDGHSPAATISRGSIASVRRSNTGGVELLQLDVALNPGNSGGPVVDERGRVVGVSVATLRGTGISFIVPWEHAEALLEGRAAKVSLLPGDCAPECTAAATVEVSDPFRKTDLVELRAIDPDDTFLTAARESPYAAEGFKIADAERPASGQLVLRTNVTFARDRERYLQLAYRQGSKMVYGLPFAAVIDRTKLRAERPPPAPAPSPSPAPEPPPAPVDPEPPPRAQATECAAPPSGIIAWWDGDSINGKTARNLRGRHDGAMSNVQLEEGTVGRAFRFDGAGVIQVPFSRDLVPGEQLTIEGWVRPLGAQPGHARIIGVQTDYSTDSSWVFGVGSSGGIYFGAFHANAQSYIDGSTAIHASTWTHIAGTWDGTMMRAYVNGVPERSVATFAGRLDGPSVPLRIGRGDTTKLGFRGLVDELTLYGRALTRAELEAIVAAGPLGKCKPQ